MKTHVTQKAVVPTPTYTDYQIAAMEAQKRKVRAEIKATVAQGNGLIHELNEEIKRLKGAR